MILCHTIPRQLEIVCMGDDSKDKRQRDFDDLQNEMAGREVGRIRRFLSEDAWDQIRESRTGEKKGNLSKLQLLLLHNPAYQELYQKVEATLERVQNATDKALEDIQNEIQKLENKLEFMEECASRLPNGTRVFKSKDSNKAFTKTGREISATELSMVIWNQGSHTWEEYQETKTRLEQARKEKSDVEHYQKEVLQPANNRIHDPDNPSSEDDLENILSDIQGKMPEAVRKRLDQAENPKDTPSNISEVRSFAGDSGLNAPNMKTHFETASLDIPDLDSLDQKQTPTSSPNNIS